MLFFSVFAYFFGTTFGIRKSSFRADLQTDTLNHTLSGVFHSEKTSGNFRQSKCSVTYCMYPSNPSRSRA